MKRTFTFTDEKSNKFWTIEITGSQFTVNFGKVGTAGQTQLKEFANEEECLKAANKLIAEKTKKGYEETDGTSTTLNTDKPEIEDKEENIVDYDDSASGSDMSNEIKVNLQEVSDIKRVLQMLIANIKEVGKLASPNDGIMYGRMEDGEFEPFDEETEKSEAIFFEHAAKHEELHKLIIKYAELADKNQFVNSVSDMRMGMNAVYALALQDDKYIPLFIEHHRKIRPGGGESQMDHIINLMSDTDNGLKLLAACCMYVIDQPDIEYNIEPWMEEYVGENRKKQEKVFKYMMEEAAKMSDTEFLVDYFSEALDAMGIEYDEEKLEEVLEELDGDKLPKLKDVI